MHDKFGATALSERWIQCVCQKRIMLNKPRALKYFEASKSFLCKLIGGTINKKQTQTNCIKNPTVEETNQLAIYTNRWSGQWGNRTRTLRIANLAPYPLDYMLASSVEMLHGMQHYILEDLDLYVLFFNQQNRQGSLEAECS